jgi:hypothetical protein
VGRVFEEARIVTNSRVEQDVLGIGENRWLRACRLCERIDLDLLAVIDSLATSASPWLGSDPLPSADSMRKGTQSACPRKKLHDEVLFSHRLLNRRTQTYAFAQGQ